MKRIILGLAATTAILAFNGGTPVGACPYPDPTDPRNEACAPETTVVDTTTPEVPTTTVPEESTTTVPASTFPPDTEPEVPPTDPPGTPVDTDGVVIPDTCLLYPYAVGNTIPPGEWHYTQGTEVAEGTGNRTPIGCARNVVDDGICHEDEACFDCATMGNRQCGPTPPAPVTRLPETGSASLYTALIALGFCGIGGSIWKVARR